MNYYYEISVWKQYEHQDQLGIPQHKMFAKTYLKALEEYNKVDKYMCKMLIQYKANDEDSDGDVLEEDWIGMSEYKTDTYEVNKQYQVLVWEKYEYEEQLGSPQIEEDFDNIAKAYIYYQNVSKYMCKMIMKYESSDPASSGDVLEEDWNE